MRILQKIWEQKVVKHPDKVYYRNFLKTEIKKRKYFYKNPEETGAWKILCLQVEQPLDYKDFLWPRNLEQFVKLYI